MTIPIKCIDALFRSIETADTERRTGAKNSATRGDVVALMDCLSAVQLLRFLAMDDSRQLDKLLKHQPDDAEFETALLGESEETWKKRVDQPAHVQSQEIGATQSRIAKYRTDVVTNWTGAEPIATRVLEAARLARYDASDCIAVACRLARLLALNLFAPQEGIGVFDQAIAALERFAPIVVERTPLAHPSQTTIVLWAGADNAPYNRRVALTCSAYLESHGNVSEALLALLREGHKVSQSSFYAHLGFRDKQTPGWRRGVISEQVGKFEHGVSSRHNGKQAVPKG